jgi:hypothetical protein
MGAAMVTERYAKVTDFRQRCAAANASIGKPLIRATRANQW